MFIGNYPRAVTDAPVVLSVGAIVAIVEGAIIFTMVVYTAVTKGVFSCCCGGGGNKRSAAGFQRW